MPEAGYDGFADSYAAFVASDAADPLTALGGATVHVLAVAGEVDGLRVCDLGCGEGHLSRVLAARGGRVVGVDVSRRMLALARQRTPRPGLDYLLADAQQTLPLPAAAFDLAISNMALMDIPDLAAVYRAVARILRPGGRFVASITHPCFQSPHSSPETDDEGAFTARRVVQYVEEGFWRSGRNIDTVRATVGAVHRTLATYLNGLIAAGFTLERLVEPTLKERPVPDLMVFAARCYASAVGT